MSINSRSHQSHALSLNALNLVAARFRVLGEPLRLRLLNALREGEKSVTDLVEISETSQANVSKHLGILTDAGLVARRREGTFAFYHIADELVFQLCDLVCSRLKAELEAKAAHLSPAKPRPTRRRTTTDK